MDGRGLSLAPEYIDIAVILLDIEFNLAEAIDKAHMLGASADFISFQLSETSFNY